MNYIDKTKELTDKIKALEETKYDEYGIKFNIKTPTVIQYYVDNLKNGNFNPVKSDTFNLKYNLILGIKSEGWANRNFNYICVLTKDYENFVHFLSMPIKYMNKKLPMQDINITDVTFHEIRHIVQNSGYTLSAYDYFCCQRLSDYSTLKVLTNHQYHNSLYSEIDANLYAAQESKKFFKGYADIEEFFNTLIGIYGLQKYTYDFDSELEKYQTKNENFGLEYNGMRHYECFIWNFDGSFKRPREIPDDPHYYNCQTKKYPALKEFHLMVISSDAYLSRLNIDSLDKEEVVFIIDNINGAIKELKKSKKEIKKLLDEKAITDETYQNAINILDERISRKEQYAINLSQKFDIENSKAKTLEKDISNNEETIRLENMNVQSLVMDMLKPEPPKKIKLVTRAKNKLKSIINDIKNMRIGKAIVCMLPLADLFSLMINSENPLVKGIPIWTLLGTSVLASEIYKRNSNKK